MKRYAVNKQRSSRDFNRKDGRTKAINMKGAPMRGGIRL